MNNSIIPRSAPEAQGVSSTAILNYLDALDEKNFSIHSLMLLRHGNVIAEGWWQPYAPEHKRYVYSLSKSFTSSAVGFAVAEGLLTVEDKVISFFPDDLPAPSWSPIGLGAHPGSGVSPMHDWPEGPADEGAPSNLEEIAEAVRMSVQLKPIENREPTNLSDSVA